MPKMDSKGNRRKALLQPVTLLLLFALAIFAVPRNSRGRQAGTASTAPAAFPLTTGTAWLYQAVVRWRPANPNTPAQEKLIQWKMEVDRVIRRGNLVAAVIKGFPRDLDESHGDTQPAQSMIVESGGSKFYWIPPDVFATALAKLEDPKASLAGLTDDNNLFLDLPLSRGKKFCDMTGMIRTDGFYCWVAGEPQAADLAGAKGIPPGAHTAYPVQFLTADDSTSFDFVPDIGITSYRYQNHGTGADTELQLVEFQPGAH